jgi:hypothetical protein
LVLYYGAVDEDEVNKHCRDGAAAAGPERFADDKFLARKALFPSTSTFSAQALRSLGILSSCPISASPLAYTYFILFSCSYVHWPFYFGELSLYFIDMADLNDVGMFPSQNLQILPDMSLVLPKSCVTLGMKLD